MSASRRIRTVVATSALALAAACGDEGPSTPAPVPGELTATLVSPRGAEAGAVLEIPTARLEGVLPLEADGRLFVVPLGETTRIIVVLVEPGVVEFGFTTDDVTDPPVVEVVQVADPQNGSRDPAPYRVQVTEAGS